MYEIESDIPFAAVICIRQHKPQTTTTIFKGYCGSKIDFAVAVTSGLVVSAVSRHERCKPDCEFCIRMIASGTKIIEAKAK